MKIKVHPKSMANSPPGAKGSWRRPDAASATTKASYRYRAAEHEAAGAKHEAAEARGCRNGVGDVSARKVILDHAVPSALHAWPPGMGYVMGWPSTSWSQLPRLSIHKKGFFRFAVEPLQRASLSLHCRGCACYFCSSVSHASLVLEHDPVEPTA